MMFFGAASGLSNPFWIESDAASLLIAGLFVLAGIFLGYALRSLVGRWQADSIEKKMKLRAEEAEAELSARRQAADIAARAEVVKAREEFEKSVAKRREEQAAADARLAAREAKADEKSLQLDSREAVLRAKAETAERARQDAASATAEADARLQKIAKMTHEEARKAILTQTNAALRDDAVSMSRRIQEAAKEQGETIARNIVVHAIQRCAVTHLNELTTASVAMPNAEMKGRIVGRDGRNVRAFEAATGVTLLMDDAPDMVVLSAFEPMRREIARRALEALVADGRIHPAAIEDAVKAARTEVDSGNIEAATAAAAEAGVPGLAGEILDQVGRLRFRTSFSQNVLRHSVEVALLSGALAAEAGLDPARARRIGFLHDIGKASTGGDKRGSHAQIGADFLKVHGEDAVVCAAVAAHHGEGESDGGVYGVICAAADAISSARPGARQETLGDYVQRLENVEKIAGAHDGVESVLAVQAGRDLRVVVDPAKISDVEAQELARDIAREISATQRFPGMIRVTIIRETRCVEYAK